MAKWTTYTHVAIERGSWRSCFTRRLITYALTKGKELKQEAPQRDRVTRYVSRNLVKCCTVVRKVTFERLAVGNDLEGGSRSYELPLFDRPCITCYWWSVTWAAVSRLTVCDVTACWSRDTHLPCRVVSGQWWTVQFVSMIVVWSCSAQSLSLIHWRESAMLICITLLLLLLLLRCVRLQISSVCLNTGAADVRRLVSRDVDDCWQSTHI